MCKDVSTAQVQLGILTATAGLISIPYGKIPSGIKTVVGSEGFTLRDSKLIVTLHDQTHYVVGESLVLENPPTYTYLLIPDTDTRRLHQIRALDQQFPNGPKPKQYVDSFLKILSPVYSDVPSISQWDVPPDYPTSPAQMTAQSPQSSSEVSRYIHPIGGVGDCFPESITRALLDDPEGVAYLKELAAEFGQPNLSDDKLVGFGTTYFRKQISQNLPSIDKVLTSHHCSLILSALNNDEDTLAEVLKGILPDSIADHLVSLLIQNKALFNPDLNPDKETLMRVFNDGLPEGVVSIDEWRKSEVGTAGVSIGVIDLNSDFISHETCRIVHEGCPGTTQYKLTIKVGDKPIVIFVSYHGGHYNPILKLTPSP